MESINSGMNGLQISISSSTSSDIPLTEQQEQEEKTEINNYGNSANYYHLTKAVQEFLNPLKKEILKAIQNDKTVEEQVKRRELAESLDIPKLLLQSLCQFIWVPDLIYTEKGILRRLYNQMNYHFLVKEGQSDLDDMLEYKPSEPMAYKAIQVFIALVLPDPELFQKELSNFKTLIEDTRIARDGRAEQAYLFLYKTFKTLFALMSDELSEEESRTVPENFENLSLPVRCVIEALSVVFIKQFRLKPQERLAKMKRVVLNDESSHEWCLYAADILRLKRRESATSRAQWQTQEEMNLLERAISIASDNPFVRLTVLDTVIGSVRDANGRFCCGELKLGNMEEAIRFLQDSSRKLTTDFPKNVMFNSVVSDYFARYVPLLYFDVDLSLRLLMIAYELNPSHPKTTHRLGILHRMSFGDIDESLKWFKKTIELDPTHYPAQMEYFKTILGKPDKYDGAMLMQKTLESSASEGWTNYEKADFIFYLGIANFIQEKREETLFWWKEASKYNESQFTLVDMQDTLLFYEWSTDVVSSDKLRLWIKGEIDDLSRQENSGEVVSNSEKKQFINRLFGLMLGRRIPKRASLNVGFKSVFPNAYLEHFVVSV